MGDMEQTVNDALDRIDSATDDLRQVLENAPVRQLTDELKSLGEQAVAAVQAFADQIQEAIDAEQESEEGEAPS